MIILQTMMNGMMNGMDWAADASEKERGNGKKWSGKKAHFCSCPCRVQQWIPSSSMNSYIPVVKREGES